MGVVPVLVLMPELTNAELARQYTWAKREFYGLLYSGDGIDNENLNERRLYWSIRYHQLKMELIWRFSSYSKRRKTIVAVRLRKIVIPIPTRIINGELYES